MVSKPAASRPRSSPPPPLKREISFFCLFSRFTDAYMPELFAAENLAIGLRLQFGFRCQCFGIEIFAEHRHLSTRPNVFLSLLQKPLFQTLTVTRQDRIKL